MNIKTKLAVNATTILLLMASIGAAAVIGIKHIERNIFHLTRKSTPYQIKTFDHQRALHAHASNLLKVAASQSAEDFKLNAAKSKESLDEEIGTAEELIKLGSTTDYSNDEFAEISNRINEITKKRLALQGDTIGAVAAMRNHLAEASGRLQALDASIRKLQAGATEKMVTNIVITADSNNQAAMIASLLGGLKDLNLFASRLMLAADKDVIESGYEATAAPLHKMRDLAGLIGWSAKLGQQDLVGKIETVSDRLTEAKEMRVKSLQSRDPSFQVKAARALRDAEAEIANLQNSAKLQAEYSRSAQDASADAMSSSTAAFSSTNSILILASGILLSSAVIDSQINYSVSVKNPADFQQVLASVEKEFAGIRAAAGRLNSLLSKGKFRAESRQAADSLAALQAVQSSFLGSGGAADKIKASLRNVEEVAKLNQKMKDMVARQMELSGKDVAVARQSQQGAVSSVRSAVRTTTTLIAAIAGLSVLVSILLSRWIGLSVARPVAELSRMAERFGGGDFGVRMDDSRKDEFGVLAAHFNQATAKLAEITGLLKGAIDKLLTGSQTLHKTSDRLLQGAREQASQATQSSVAMAQITATVETVAGHARDSAAASKEAHAIASSGNLLVGKTVQGMQQICASVMAAAANINKLSESSERIDSILATINDIADQTNLLALNAAIEAARAGEQGRGFAVVADEVRKLARRTAEATNEIAEIIRVIQTDTAGSVSAMQEGKLKVEEGSCLAQEASESLDAIVAVSRRGAEMAEMIATATDEQSVASREVSQSMEKITNVTGTLQHSTVEIKEASEQLSSIAGELNGVASWFKPAC